MLRNHLGEFLATSAGPISMTTSAFHAELIAARRAMLLAKSHCLEGLKIMFEGDSAMVVAAMKDQGDDCSLFSPIINDVRFFHNGLIHLKFSHVQREGNLAAHRPACMGIGSSQEFV